jgi:hypothetical protein
MRRRHARLAAGLALATVTLAVGLQAAASQGRRFYPDDPIWTDPDRAVDAGDLPAIDDGDLFDFARNTFLKGGTGERIDTPARNVNTLDEVPDSSWFTNRIGRRDLTVEGIVRGPDREGRARAPRPVDTATIDTGTIDTRDWQVVALKTEGLQPGYRVVDPEGHLWQVEFDPPSNPEMATGAEIIGTAFYHAFGYHVVEVALTDVDTATLKISPKATVDDATTRRKRPLTREDIALVLRNAARRADGTYRAIASRFADGRPIGHFRYFGTRPDDPNDIFPHEHRRELRGARVFAAWLNHDDSRGINSLDMLEGEPGRRWVKHYMFDFGSILGSGTYGPQTPRAGNEYIFEWKPGLMTLATFGLYFKPWVTYRYPDVPPSVGRLEGERFDPLLWKPEYPNTAFDNMRPEDAFWAARIVARFSEDAIRAVVGKARYTDPRASEYLTRTLMARREKVLRAWLTGVNPVVDARVNRDGRFTASNIAVAAGVARPPTTYTLSWFEFDEASGEANKLVETVRIGGADGHINAETPAALLASQEGTGHVGVRIRGYHPDHPSWVTNPADFYFRRTPEGWETVGVERHKAVVLETLYDE